MMYVGFVRIQGEEPDERTRAFTSRTIVSSVDELVHCLMQGIESARRTKCYEVYVATADIAQQAYEKMTGKKDPVPTGWHVGAFNGARYRYFFEPNTVPHPCHNMELREIRENVGCQ